MSVQHIGSSEFADKIIDGKQKALVDFFATWCGPCRMQAPILDELETEISGKGVSVYKLDVDEAPDIAARYQVASIPTLILFEGGEPAKRATGLQSKIQLTQMCGV